jgi:hypothetical protein
MEGTNMNLQEQDRVDLFQEQVAVQKKIASAILGLGLHPDSPVAIYNGGTMSTIGPKETRKVSFGAHGARAELTYTRQEWLAYPDRIIRRIEDAAHSLKRS